jgi:CheY-like chemotaxis protein
LARRILLADDSVTAQNMGRRILTDAGYEVVTVNNGSAALKKIAEQKPDLVVLDVYMPGYGGLEVCQRIKEARETARIPVLLTVGKLEPFKPDEARKARADAYIVKPFEASELLTALTKLEDKIVPQGGPYKPGRFAKAVAAAEEAELEERFGDKETGWKDRLTLPSPGSTGQPQGGEPEFTQLVSKTPDHLDRGEDFKPAEPSREFQRPIPAGLPPDITPEEIAAITAAAAAFGGKIEAPAAETGPPRVEAQPEPAAERKEEKSEPVVPTASTPEAAAPATFASASEAPAESRPVAEAASTADETRKASDIPAEQAGTGAAARSVPEGMVADPEKPWTMDAEVLAAIASLAPTNGQAAEGVQSTEQDASIPSRIASAGVSGPRWIAESVSVEGAESTFVLEREMEKAYAAFAAADAARTGFVDALSTAAISSTIKAASKASAEPAPPAIAATSTQAASVEITPAKEAAYAAAASAGSGVAESTSAAEITSPISPGSTPHALEPGDSDREAQLAAAWANWKQVRESESPPASQTTEVSDVAKKDSPESSSSEVEAEASPAAAASDSPEIASIVDSMLAELKPKLMEEIARKMGSEKKKKKKKD